MSRGRQVASKESSIDDLRMQVLTLALAPGSDLDEGTLCAAYGLSRTPLREILQRLAGEGYVTLAPRRGAKVASMDLSRMRTFFQTAPLVYAGVARMAAERATKAEQSALKAIQVAFCAATDAGDAGEAALLNHQFHAKIGVMADNPYLDAALGRMLIDHTRLSQTFYRPTSEPERALVVKAAEQHDAMIAAFEDRDPEAAVDVTLRHWDLSRDQLEKYVRPDPLPFDMESLSNAI